MPRMQRGLPQKRRIPGCKKVVVVSSGKGGVGKSSVAGECVLGAAAVDGRLQQDATRVRRDASSEALPAGQRHPLIAPMLTV